MLNLGNKLESGRLKKLSKPYEPVRVILFLMLIVAVAALVYLIINYIDSRNGDVVKKTNQKHLATVEDEQKRYQNAINNNLTNGNVDSYMNSQLELANRYVTAGKYDDANDILKSVQKNVPQEKLNVYYYQIKVSVDENIKDIPAEKADLAKLITMLQAAKRINEAGYYQRKLNNL